MEQTRGHGPGQSGDLTAVVDQDMTLTLAKTIIVLLVFFSFSNIFLQVWAMTPPFWMKGYEQKQDDARVPSLS